MANMKTVVLKQALPTINYGAHEQKSRDLGKSGVTAVTHSCLAPGHTAARAHVAPLASALSPARLFQSLVNDEYSGKQWARWPEKGEECIRPQCRFLSHTLPKRDSQS